ncbi:MAG: bifunctional DNA-formamidopyrimidine glycosylase/DNA-(apurinic or apyrimidinic site) lyase [Gammaproteobacteria bacterium]|nr:bifunctional DNA-formamidopyrimidine glycosylase/DNA-(apurinic or apyrimidinic site) lyase [Pseudomonadales bacterium]MCP5347605.1 bifunctional DNA-formamidopyrimidine glycosylase/DNA-(apurinic or apyrimidinic site) lyase [Pseudomonadales bacterium]
MPELPEVETTRRGITSSLLHKPITAVRVRTSQLRWPVPGQLGRILSGSAFERIERRAKYLLLNNGKGTLIIHLGMSGSLRLVPADGPAGKHDHVDIVLADGQALRFTDPRKFGCLLWHEGPIAGHPLLQHLGPEPLTDAFNGAYLKRLSRGRKLAVKSFIMDGAVVVGVGNIYANESLFNAGIRPSRPAGRISLGRYELLATEIKQVLQNAIDVGGTTLRDFTGGDGKPGYFKQSLRVYGRGKLPCKVCQTPLTEIRLGQRSTVYCQSCQT